MILMCYKKRTQEEYWDTVHAPILSGNVQPNYQTSDYGYSRENPSMEGCLLNPVSLTFQRPFRFLFNSVSYVPLRAWRSELINSVVSKLISIWPQPGRVTECEH